MTPTANIGQTLPRRGQVLPEITFTGIDGGTFRLSDFKDRKNVVLIFGAENAPRLLDEIARRKVDFDLADGQVIAVLGDATEIHEDRPFPLAIEAVPARDIDLQSYETGETAVYVADRWGEVFYTRQSGPGETAPEATDILEWLRFVVMQCEECFPTEWPAVP